MTTKDFIKTTKQIYIDRQLKGFRINKSLEQNRRSRICATIINPNSIRGKRLEEKITD